MPQRSLQLSATHNVGYRFHRIGTAAMRVASCLLVVSLLIADGAYAEPPASYNASRRLLSDIHEDIGHLVTLYCGCPYKRVGGTGGDINSEPCGHETRTDETRSGEVEWEHVTPASWFGAHRPCWKGHEQCVRMSGKDKGNRTASVTAVTSEVWTPSFERRSSIRTTSFPPTERLTTTAAIMHMGRYRARIASTGRATSRLVAHPRLLSPTGVSVASSLGQCSIWRINTECASGCRAIRCSRGMRPTRQRIGSVAVRTGLRQRPGCAIRTSVRHKRGSGRV